MGKVRRGYRGGRFGSLRVVLRSRVGSPGILVIEDAHREPRLAASREQNELVRFYAGYPLEAPTGHRVGVLCIMDDKPRSFGSQEPSLLRELALQVRAELW